MTQPIKILLVEDNPGDADLTRETLEEGELILDISVVSDGAQAVEFLLRRGAYTAATIPDLIILDLNLPKLDGRGVLAEIRTYERLRKIPIVVLTSSDAESDIAQSYSLGANCYVTKPRDLEGYQATVRSIESFWFMVAKLP